MQSLLRFGRQSGSLLKVVMLKLVPPVAALLLCLALGILSVLLKCSTQLVFLKVFRSRIL